MPDPATITITYVYSTQTYETTVLAGSKVVLEKEPFYFLGKKISKYTSNESPSVTYLPGQLITAPNSNLTLTVGALEDIGHVKVATGPSTYVDISNAVINIKRRKGKNQPFAYVVITVLKELFNDLDLTLVQKETKFITNVYGITGTWIYERLEDNGSTYDLTLVDKSYYLKTITLLSLFNFSITNQQGTAITLTNMPSSVTASAITWSALAEDSNTQYGTFTATVPNNITLTFTIKRVDLSETSTPDYEYSLIKVEGSPDDIFKFLVKVVAEKDPYVHTGYFYSTDPAQLYTTAQIEAMVPNTIDSREPVFASVSLRLDQFCWDVLESIALLTDRYIVFDGTQAHFIHYYPDSVTYIVDWEEPSNLAFNEIYIPALALASNEDQGSQYVMSSQKVICEAYETTVAISDTTSTDVGADIVFGSPDNTPLSTGNSDPNAIRNTQARIIALNSIIRRYKPGDCIQFSLNLSQPPTATQTVTDLSTVSDPTNTSGVLKYIKMLDDTQIEEYETYFTSQKIPNSTPARYVWVEYDSDNPNINRSLNFSINTCLHKLIDNHNNITLNDAPLALVETEYPSCITTYTWGMPEFMDEQSQFSELTAVAQDTVLDNTSDTQISSCDASKIVVGNQSISELQHDRKGFTGLIMEKNVDNQVYRLVGYNQGEVQAEFNSQGEIQSGAGNVVINHEGITLNGGVDINLVDNTSRIIANTVILDHTGLNAYTSVNASTEPPTVGTNTVSIESGGNIVAGSGAIELGVIGNNNLVTKNGNTVQCYISNTGELMAGAGAVTLNASGLIISDKANITLGANSKIIANKIILDSSGLKSYGAISGGSGVGNPLVSIGSDGNISAGQDNIKIGKITVGSKDYALVTYNSSDPVAYITTTGQFVAGNALNGWTVMDNLGLRVYSKGANPVTSVSREPILWVNDTGYHLSNTLDGSATTLVDAEVTYGTWNNFVSSGGDIKASVNLLSNVNMNVGPVCMDTDGTIYYSTVLSQEGLNTYSYTYSGTQGAATNVQSTLQCKIDNKGVIVAGGGQVKLDEFGLRTYASNALSGDPVCQVDSSGNITGISVSANKITAGIISANNAIVLSHDNAQILVGPVLNNNVWGVPVTSTGLNRYYKQGSYIHFYQPNGYEITLTEVALTGVPYDSSWLTKQTPSEYGGIIPVTIADGGTLRIKLTYNDGTNDVTFTCIIDVRSSNIPASRFHVCLNKDGLSTYNDSGVLQCSVSTSGAFTAGGAVLNSDGVTINYDGSNYASASALKFYDTTNTWTPYKLYATYDSSGATSIVKAESKTTGTTIPSKLKMIVDGGGVTGSVTTYTTNYPNDNISSVTLYRYSNTTWTAPPSDTQTITTSNYGNISISNASSTYSIYVNLAYTKSPSVTVTTPSDSTYYIDCSFTAYMSDGTSYTFKSYDDNGDSARGTRYIFSSGSSSIIAVSINVKGASNTTFNLNKYPINLYTSSGDGASIALDQEGTKIQGNNTINGQLYQSGGPIYFKGAGQEVPTYFDMPIVPLAVISQTSISGATIVSRGSISGATITTRGAQLATPACRNIYIASEGSTPSGSFVTGDIILFYQ